MVLKGLGQAHKTEAGLVALNLRSEAEVAEAAARMDAADFLVEEFVSDGVAEVLVGVLRDPAHGFVLTLGTGGTLTELVADAVNILLPAPPAGIDAALDGLRIAPRLSGYRGAAPADRKALLDAILAVQDFVVAHAERLEELEINPLIVTPTRAVAADALLRLGDPT